MSEQECKSFPEPQDLKDALELLEKLKDTVLAKKNVGQKLLKDVETYCKETDQFYKDSSHESTSSSFLWSVFTTAQSIRRTILDMGRTSGKYNNLDNDHGKHNDCIAEALKTCLPKAYAALYYLYFMCSKELNGMQGGTWSGQNVKASGIFGTDLHNWLTDGQKTFGGESKPFTPGLIKRGFPPGQLHDSNKGQTVAGAIKHILYHDTPEAFQKVLAYLLFACPWHESLLGHACLFLHKFCSEVSTEGERLKGKFKGYSEELKNVCQGLQSSLTSFLNGSSQSHILAVSQGNSNVYTGVFKDDSLDAYCDWLRGNLKNIIGSLEKMSSDCKTWGTSMSFQMGFTAGPFKYGFVPKDSDWMNRIDEKLQGPIQTLTASLRELQQCLKGAETQFAPSRDGLSSGRSESQSRGTPEASSALGSGGHSTGTPSSGFGSSGSSSIQGSPGESQGESSEGSSTASIVGASVGTLGGTAALGGLGYFLRGFLFGV
ncbi:secreted antigen 1 [Babesia divergens]|uniref:Secreted antigen 1 n=1 Tax=Babesia divergens TaxID=32595 RepID=A0AAD9GBL6_BABDI|nr:secreted antigen 1 [Babesia divergens]